MLSLGVVERSNSVWSSPILLVPKKDKTYRFCVDYQISERDAYPLPFVNNTLDKLRDAKFLSSLDIRSAYWHIPIAEQSRQYTAFTVPNRGPELEPFVFVYLDDIVIVTQIFEKHTAIFGEIFEKHTAIFGEVLSRLRNSGLSLSKDKCHFCRDELRYNSGLSLSKDKCHFCRDELRYLGYVVNQRGLIVDPDKVKAILEIPTPKTVSETAECDSAWSNLRERLVSPPILTCPDFNHVFTIQTDASDIGLGAVLSQTIDGQERAINYLSRSLNANERKFSTVEKERLAVLWATEKLRPHIDGSHFTVITDHYSLCWLNRLNSPTGRLARWAVQLQQYDYTIIHRKGKFHVVPDALSRSVPKVDLINISADSKDKYYLRLLDGVKTNPERHPLFQIIDGRLCSSHSFSVDDTDHWKYVVPKEQRREVIRACHDLHHWKYVVPKEQRREVIRACHDLPICGHLGLSKTFSRVAQDFWPKMLADIARYINSCAVCIRSKPVQQKPIGRMGDHTRISKTWDVLGIDLVGSLPRTKQGKQLYLDDL
ncbi:RNase H-like domain found in reverse transcriptase [Popillia japonica]